MNARSWPTFLLAVLFQAASVPAQAVVALGETAAAAAATSSGNSAAGASSAGIVPVLPTISLGMLAVPGGGLLPLSPGVLPPPTQSLPLSADLALLAPAALPFPTVPPASEQASAGGSQASPLKALIEHGSRAGDALRQEGSEDLGAASTLSFQRAAALGETHSAPGVPEASLPPGERTGGRAAEGRLLRTTDPRQGYKPDPTLPYASRALKLDNGMEVVLERKPGMFSVDIAVAYAAGSRDDGPGESGYAHFLEHLMFQGTRNVRNWWRVVGAMGAYINAHTYRDHTTYKWTVPWNMLDLALLLEGERMDNPDFTGDKIPRERDVVLEERAGYYDQAYADGLEGLKALAFSRKANQTDTLGSPADLEAATPEKLQRFYDTYYGPENAKVIVSGHLDLDVAERLVKETLGKVERRGGQAPVRPDLSDPEPAGPGKVEISDAFAKHPAQLFAWRAPDRTDPRHHALTMAALLIQQRLQRRLILEQRKAFSAALTLPYLERGPIMLSGSIVHDASLTPEEALASLQTEIEAVARGDFPPADLDLQRQAQIESVRRPFGARQNAEVLAAARAHGMTMKDVQADLDRWATVTPQEVAAAAADILSIQRRQVVSVTPAAQGKTASGVQATERVAQPEAEPAWMEEEVMRELEQARWPGFTYPDPAVFTLSNGLKVIVYRDVQGDVVHAKLGFRMGTTASDGADKDRVPLAAELLRYRTRDLSTEKLRALLAEFNGRLAFDRKWDHSVLDGSVPSDHARDLLAVMGDIVARPYRWTPQELDGLKGWWRESLKQNLGHPLIASGLRALKDLLGDHPSARGQALPETVDALTLQDLERLSREHFSPDNAVLVLAGNVDADRAKVELERLFEGWKPSGKKPPEAREAPARPQDAISWLERRDSAQTLMRVSAVAPGAGRRTHPDHFPLVVANQLLGQGPASRLFQGLRQSLSYIYGPFSEVNTDPLLAVWTFGLSTRPGQTGPALRALLGEVERLRTQTPGSFDLAAAKNALIGTFLIGLNQVGFIADQLLGLDLFEVPLKELSLYPRRVSDVTAEAVQDVASRLLRPEALAIAMVGDSAASKAAEATAGIRPLRTLDEEGTGPVETPAASVSGARNLLSRFLRRKEKP